MSKEAVVTTVVVKEAIVIFKMALTPTMSPVNLITKIGPQYQKKMILRIIVDPVSTNFLVKNKWCTTSSVNNGNNNDN